VVTSLFVIVIVVCLVLINATIHRSINEHKANEKATLWETFMRVASWNVAVRYTTFQVTRSEAEAFMSSINAVVLRR
jgi:hypothetical protein